MANALIAGCHHYNVTEEPTCWTSLLRRRQQPPIGKRIIWIRSRIEAIYRMQHNRPSSLSRRGKQDHRKWSRSICRCSSLGTLPNLPRTNTCNSNVLILCPGRPFRSNPRHTLTHDRLRRFYPRTRKGCGQHDRQTRWSFPLWPHRVRRHRKTDQQLHSRHLDSISFWRSQLRHQNGHTIQAN